jgi:hypothetical protein
MSKKTYFLILILIIVATYLAYIAAFRKTATKLVTQAPTQTTVPLYKATLSLDPNPLLISPLQSVGQGSIGVVLDTVGQKASGVQIELSYDPKIISNVTITAGTFITNPAELIKNVDQVNGRISYALGIAPQSPQVEGKGTVATITFTANTQLAKTTQIEFLPKTLVTEQGATSSILKSSTGSTILFQTPVSSPAVSPQSGTSSAKSAQ